MPYNDEGVGWKRTDTSAQAAEEITPKAATVRVKVETALRDHADGLTGDELSEQLRIDKLTVRPRITELREAGRVVDTGRRRMNHIGKRVIVWAHRDNWRSIGEIVGELADDMARKRTGGAS
jgi:transcription initiation factor IIE alpha subunit